MRNKLSVYPVVDIDNYGGTLVEAAIRVRALMAGGATIVQLREKKDRFSILQELFRSVQSYAEKASVPLIVNDRLDLALALGADGVHLGQSDMRPSVARKIAGPDFCIGVSVSTSVEAVRALNEGADYISVSPFLGTPTKPNASKPAGFEGLEEIRRSCPLAAIVAIGGVSPGNTAQIIRAGADGVAFVSAASKRPEEVARCFADVVQKARSERDGGEFASASGLSDMAQGRGTLCV